MKCCICNKPIPKARLDFLLSTHVIEQDLTCLAHSQTQKIKGIYTGEHGTSDMFLCDKVYNDSVRSKFINIEECNSSSDVD